MRILKIYLTLIFLALLPIIMLSVMTFANEEVEVTYCADRNCRWNKCDDATCKNLETRLRRYDRDVFYVLKQHPGFLILLVVHLVSYILYIISLKKNAYAYIGYEDMGKLGIISLIIYFINAIALVIIPMNIYKQVGEGPLFTMLVMVIIPFIVRPIVVDW